MVMDNKWLNVAIKRARAHKYDAALSYRLCAMIVRGGKILSMGYNGHTYNGIIERYRTSEHCYAMHAEIDAVLQVRKKIDLTGAKIYVVRQRIGDKPGVNDSIGHSRPCSMCRAVLYAYGIKKAYFSIDTNTYGVMKIVAPEFDDCEY